MSLLPAGFEDEPFPFPCPDILFIINIVIILDFNDSIMLLLLPDIPILVI